MAERNDNIGETTEGTAMLAITTWPEKERPREKLLIQGASALSDAELLAIFLRTGIRGHTAVDLARLLIDEFGSLKSLMNSTEIEFCQRRGLGKAKYAQLQAVLEMSRRYMYENLKRGDALSSPQMTRDYLSSQLQGYPHEVFACLFLDNGNRVIAFEKMFFGTIDGASVYPREVVMMALKKNAAAVIFAHNHPSGIAEPSMADEKITLRLKSALQLVDIRVLDHVIVGDTMVSLAERGLI